MFSLKNITVHDMEKKECLEVECVWEYNICRREIYNQEKCNSTESKIKKRKEASMNEWQNTKHPKILN